eukprot:jgi/Pico_ML_1/56098/g1689.t1
MMNRIFGHLTFAKVYVDDILIHSSSKEAHFQHLEELLQEWARHFAPSNWPNLKMQHSL